MPSALALTGYWPCACAALIAISTGCASGGLSSAGVETSTPDQSWVDSACQPASVDTTGWRRYRVGDMTVQVPPRYSQTGLSQRPISSGSDYYGYDFAARGPGGTVWIQLHRNARYTFDRFNGARRGQKWCNGSLGGHQAEIVSWFEPFAGNRRDTNAGELVIGATYNFAARLPASWGGQDEGKWLFVYVGASRLRDAHALRDALHTLSAVKDTSYSR